jgi:hypothetical protein
MIRLKLYPDLEHCIETVARKAHLELQQQILNEPCPTEDTKKRLVLLEEFLRNADFRKLRADSEQLMINGLKVEFIIQQEDGKVGWKIQEEDRHSDP